MIMTLKVLPLTYGPKPDCKLVDVDVDGSEIEYAWFFDPAKARYVAALIEADRAKREKLENNR